MEYTLQDGNAPLGLNVVNPDIENFTLKYYTYTSLCSIVYSSGFIPITSMMKYGVLLDIAGFFIIVTLVMVLGPLVF